MTIQENIGTTDSAHCWQNHVATLLFQSSTLDLRTARGVISVEHFGNPLNRHNVVSSLHVYLEFAESIMQQTCGEFFVNRKTGRPKTLSLITLGFANGWFRRTKCGAIALRI